MYYICSLKYHYNVNQMIFNTFLIVLTTRYKINIFLLILKVSMII